MTSIGHYKIKYELYKQFSYKCFSMSLQYYKCEHQESNRAIFPPSLLSRLKIENYNRNYPMFFELGCNLSDENGNPKKTHIGAAEFIGEEGIALLPEWVLENANIKNGGNGFFKSVYLPRAENLVMVPRELSPSEGEFLKVIMEKKLRNIICLTVSDVIPVRLGSKTITLIVKDVKPGSAVSLINNDIQFSYSIPDKSYDFNSVNFTRKKWNKCEKHGRRTWNRTRNSYINDGFDGYLSPSDISVDRENVLNDGHFLKNITTEGSIRETPYIDGVDQEDPFNDDLNRDNPDIYY